MIVYKAENKEDAGRIVGNILSAQIVTKPESVLGLATGSTPETAYERMVKLYEQGDVDYSKVKTVNLDEYKGLSGDDSRSYRFFMNEKLFNRVNIDKSNTYLPDGTESDSETACTDYDAIIEGLGGIDIQLLGLGCNGHIGFNEPAEYFSLSTQCVDLAESTISANSRFFSGADEVPRQAYTMGIGTIMRAERVLLMVTGENKRDILVRALNGEVTPRLPASILRFHKNLILVGDKDALGENF